MDYSTEFVLKVNEIYHDVEEGAYEDKHPEIFTDEVIRWQKIGQLFFANAPAEIHLLDIGSGTGFVPLQLGAFLKDGDVMVCSDISAGMLTVCRENLSAARYNCQFEYFKLDGLNIDLESNRFDYITLNSVLHHIPNFTPFFKEVDRLLKINGRLVICHEPNKPFFQYRFLMLNYLIFFFLFHPSKLFKVLARFTRRLQPKHVATQDSLYADINQRLLAKGVIKTPLTKSQIIEIVDIHSPLAGGKFHNDRGINISHVQRVHLPNFEIEHFETYNHLDNISSKNKFARWYDSLLSRMFPKTGSTFLTVLKKVSSCN